MCLVLLNQWRSSTYNYALSPLAHSVWVLLNSMGKDDWITSLAILSRAVSDQTSPLLACTWVLSVKVKYHMVHCCSFLRVHLLLRSNSLRGETTTLIESSIVLQSRSGVDISLWQSTSDAAHHSHMRRTLQGGETEMTILTLSCRWLKMKMTRTCPLITHYNINLTYKMAGTNLPNQQRCYYLFWIINP